MSPSPGRAAAPLLVDAKILYCAVQFKPSCIGVLDLRVHKDFARLGADSWSCFSKAAQTD